MVHLQIFQYVIARSEATKQSTRSLRRGLLRYARNDGILFLSVLPFRLALVDEGAHSFLRGARPHVPGLPLPRLTVRLPIAPLPLPVTRPPCNFLLFTPLPHYL